MIQEIYSRLVFPGVYTHQTFICCAKTVKACFVSKDWSFLFLKNRKMVQLLDSEIIFCCCFVLLLMLPILLQAVPIKVRDGGESLGPDWPVLV